MDTTPDWFELTNLGDSAIDPGTLYYDDSSADPTDGGQLAGITTLAAGESAIYLVSWQDDFPGPNPFPPPFDPADALAAFESFWNTNGAYQVGYILDADTAGGPGLGGGGDTVNIFDGNMMGATLLATRSYPDSSNEFPADTQGVTWVNDPATSSSVHAQLGVAGAFASVGGTQVGSPGFAVPEPGSMLLLLLAVATTAFGVRWAR